MALAVGKAVGRHSSGHEQEAAVDMRRTAAAGLGMTGRSIGRLADSLARQGGHNDEGMSCRDQT